MSISKIKIRLPILAFLGFLAAPAFGAPPYGGSGLRDHGHTNPGDGGVLANPSITGGNISPTTVSATTITIGTGALVFNEPGFFGDEYIYFDTFGFHDYFIHWQSYSSLISGEKNGLDFNRDIKFEDDASVGNRVGFGTMTPDAKVRIVGNSAHSKSFAVGTSTSTYDLVVTTTGKVGIGTATPTVKFQVVGDVSFSSFSHVRAYTSANLNITTTSTPVTNFTDSATAAYDAQGEMGTSSFTATMAGYYHACFTAAISADSSSIGINQYQFIFRVNGNTRQTLSFTAVSPGNFGYQIYPAQCTTLLMAAGDALTMEAKAAPDSGQATLSGSATAGFTTLTIDRLP